MRIIVLGVEGMLGNYVSKYLKFKKYDVIFGSREFFDAAKINGPVLKGILSNPFFHQNDVVINCIGVINKRVESLGIRNTIQVNSVFPHLLNEACNHVGLRLIHITTDCVYSGKKGNYSENDPHDATDIYGKTKSLGEPELATVIRTSIIGEEVKNARSLIEWIKSNKGGTIDGYFHHKWNGVTCLRLAQEIEYIINEGKYWLGVKHFYGNTVNKYELCSMVNEIYKLGITINFKDTEIKNMKLTTVRSDVVLSKPNLYSDIELQKEFGL